MAKRPWKPRRGTLAQFGLICGRNQGPDSCEHPRVQKRGKLLYCLDCSRFLPYMPLWLMVQSEEYDRRNRPPRKIPAKPKAKRPILTQEQVDAIKAKFPSLVGRRRHKK